MSSHPSYIQAADVKPPVEHRQHRPKRQRRWWPWILLAVVISFGLMVSPLVYSGIDAAQAANHAKQSMNDVRDQMSRLDFTSAQQTIASVQSDVDRIQRDLTRISAWRFLPWIGPRIEGFDQVARAASQGIQGVSQLIDVGQSMAEVFSQTGLLTQDAVLGTSVNRSFQSLSRDEKRTILARLTSVVPKIRTARDHIDIAQQTLANIPDNEWFAPIQAAFKPLIQQVTEQRQQLDQAVSLIEVFVPLLGYPEPKQYLVLLQNADEMRPAGGFIGTVGILKVDSGDIQRLEFSDSYSIDDPAKGKLGTVPPAPIKTQLNQTEWFMRDANWSPDFPTSAQLVAQQFTKELQIAKAPATPIDGVIAIEPDLFKQLLNVTGPIKIDQTTFTADNFFTELEYAVEIGFRENGLPVAQRKEVVAKLGQTMVATLMNQPLSRWGNMLNLISGALAQKDMMISVQDPNLQKILDARKWTGRVQGSLGDYLWIVDANLGALKTDGVMDKNVTYALDAHDPSHAIATVTLTYANTNRKIDWRYTRYRSYTRIYVPEGSELISSKGATSQVDVTRELGKTVFGALWIVEPGRTGNLSFSYRVPASALSSISGGSYQLLVQKQPGAYQSLTLNLSFDKTITSATPPESSDQFGDGSYRVTKNIDTDQTFQVMLGP